MSLLEDENIPFLGEMMTDVPITLTASQQNSVAVWTLKTSMVLDDVETKSRGGHFYSRNEAEALRLDRKIPVPTNIHIGRCSDLRLEANGSVAGLIGADQTNTGNISISTFQVGHLVIQAATIHNNPATGIRVDSVPVAPGDWDQFLIQIWPHGPEDLSWPPPASFDGSGEYSFDTLKDRWKFAPPV